MSPRQLSRQWRDNCVVAICLEELPHSKEVGSVEPLDVRVTASDEGGQLLDDGLAPSGGGDLVADVFADAPVRVDQLSVGRLERSLPRGLDEAHDLGKVCVCDDLRVAAFSHDGRLVQGQCRLDHRNRQQNAVSTKDGREVVTQTDKRPSHHPTWEARRPPHLQCAASTLRGARSHHATGLSSHPRVTSALTCLAIQPGSRERD